MAADNSHRMGPEFLSWSDLCCGLHCNVIKADSLSDRCVFIGFVKFLQSTLSEICNSHSLTEWNTQNINQIKRIILHIWDLTRDCVKEGFWIFNSNLRIHDKLFYSMNVRYYAIPTRKGCVTFFKWYDIYFLCGVVYLVWKLYDDTSLDVKCVTITAGIF